jgi:hypothetical protein
MQWTRAEEQGWDTKGPAFTFKIRGALDAQGNMTALDYAARSCDYNHLGYNEPDTVLIAQLMGQRRQCRPTAAPRSRTTCTPFRTGARCSEVVGLPLDLGNADPHGQPPRSERTAVDVAAESFIDEMAAAAKADPIEFRMRMLTASNADDNGFRRPDPIAVLKAAAEKFGGSRVRAEPGAPQRRHSHRPRRRLHIPQPDGGRRDRGSRSESEDGPRLGEAAGVRARLRAGHQPRGAAPHDRRRHAALDQPRPLRRGGLRQREGTQRGLGRRIRRSRTWTRRRRSTS